MKDLKGRALLAWLVAFTLVATGVSKEGRLLDLDIIIDLSLLLRLLFSSAHRSPRSPCFSALYVFSSAFGRTLLRGLYDHRSIRYPCHLILLCLATLVTSYT